MTTRTAGAIDIDVESVVTQRRGCMNTPGHRIDSRFRLEASLVHARVLTRRTRRARPTLWGRCLLIQAAIIVAGSISTAQLSPPETPFWCPMHPEIRGSSSRETCPRCGMALVPVTPATYGKYDMDVELRPRVVRAQRDVKARFLVRQRDSGKVVRGYAVVHERPFHLFVVSHDLTYFAHVHPAPRRDGSLELTLRLPKPGVYRLLADFVPTDAAPQWIEKTIVTADYNGTIADAAAALEPDLADKVEAGIRVSLGMSPPVAGREQLIAFDLADDRTRAPIDDLQPYLGASGHLLIVSEDIADAAHSHPVAGVSTARGPQVVFQVLFARAGLYRVWAQFQRAGRVVTVPFTIPVGPSGGP